MVLIEGYNIIKVVMQLPDTIRKIMLANVAFVPSFHINIVSFDRLMQKNIH
jgi:hypothetical protein